MVDYAAIVRAQVHKPAPLRIHTAQLNFGKIIPKKEPYVFIDTTWKSGGAFSKAYLAPDASYLFAYKNSAQEYGDKLNYCKFYVRGLHQNKEIILERFNTFVETSGVTDIVLGCYCNGGKFCHRHLLARFLADTLSNCVRGGELDKDSFTYCDDAHPIVIDVVGSDAELAVVYKHFAMAFGNHVMFMEEVDPLVLEAKARQVLRERRGPIINFTSAKFMSEHSVSIKCDENTIDRINRLMWTEHTLLAPLNDKRFDEEMDKLYTLKEAGDA